MTTLRAVKESPLGQGKNEKIGYVLDVSGWGTYSSGAACRVEDEFGADLSSDFLSGTVSVSGNNITSPLVQSLQSGARYKLVFQWVSGSNTYEAYLEIIGED